MAHSSYQHFFGVDFKKAKSLFDIDKWTNYDNYENNALREKLLTERIEKFIEVKWDINKKDQLALLDNIKDVDMLVTWNYLCFGTILTFSIRNFKSHMIMELIKRGAYLNVEELKGYKPFYNLSKEVTLFSVTHLINHLNALEILRSENIDRNNINTPNEYIIGCDNTIKVLIENGIYLDITECEKLKVYNPQYLNDHLTFINKLKSLIESQTVKVIGEMIFNYLISEKVIEYLNKN